MYAVPGCWVIQIVSSYNMPNIVHPSTPSSLTPLPFPLSEARERERERERGGERPLHPKAISKEW